MIKPDDSALEQHGRLRAQHARDVGAARRDPERRERRGGRVPGPRVHAQATSPTEQQGAAGRQHHRHRPRLPRQVHAAPRRAPALPQRRRLVHQGTRPSLVPAGLLQRARESTADTAPSPTSSSRSASSSTTAGPCSSPIPGPTSDDAQAVSAAVVSRVRLQTVIDSPVAFATRSPAEQVAWWV